MSSAYGAFVYALRYVFQFQTDRAETYWFVVVDLVLHVGLTSMARVRGVGLHWWNGSKPFF